MNINELINILLQNKPSEYIIDKELFKLIPELEKCKGFNQNNPWHIFDVYDHTLCVVDNVSVNLTLRLAALFHDIGKPETYKKDEKGIGHFYNHWEVSKQIFLKFANKYNLNDKLTKTVSKLIYYHDFNIDKLEYSDVINEFNQDEMIMLFELKKADLLAQNQKYHYLLHDYNEMKNKILKKYYNYQ